MKSVFQNLKEVVLAGIMFLLPIFIVIIVIQKLWKKILGLVKIIANATGATQIFPPALYAVVYGVILLILFLVCGFLVRFAWAQAFRNSMEEKLKDFIPGYSTYKAAAEEKLLPKKKEKSPYQSVWVNISGEMQPAYLIERDDSGNVIVFIPEAPQVTVGKVCWVKEKDIFEIDGLEIEQLQQNLKQFGKGLLVHVNSKPPQTPQKGSDDLQEAA